MSEAVSLAFMVLVGLASLWSFVGGVSSIVTSYRNMLSDREENRVRTSTYGTEKREKERGIKDAVREGERLSSQERQLTHELNGSRSVRRDEQNKIDDERQKIADIVGLAEEVGLVRKGDDSRIRVLDNPDLDQRELENLREILSLLEGENQDEQKNPIEAIQVSEFISVRPIEGGEYTSSSPVGEKGSGIEPGVDRKMREILGNRLAGEAEARRNERREGGRGWGRGRGKT